MRVLIVDDDELVRTLTGLLLNEMGVKVTIQAANGREALALLKSNPPDLIISDWSMPGMDGLEFLRACKEDRALRDIPFIMSSGETLRTKIKEVEEAGAEAYIMKPFSFDALQDTIERIWSNHTVSHCL